MGIRLGKMTTGISVVIPTYNERRNIPGIVAHSLDALDEYESEIIIVDDDSKDLTWQVARNVFNDHDHVQVVRRTEESGLATAVSRGFDEASHDYYAVIDADFQHPPEVLSDIARALEEGADIAIGSRYVADGAIDNWTSYRKIVSQSASAIAKISIPRISDISDPLSGFFWCEQ